MRMVLFLGLSILGALMDRVNTQMRETRFLHSYFEKTSSSITSYSTSLLNINSDYQCGNQCSFDYLCTRFEFCPNNPSEKCTLYQSGSTCHEKINEKSSGGCKCFRMELMRYEDETCRCPVGYHGHGQQCCQQVIKGCTEGVMFNTLNQRLNVISFIKPLSYNEEPFEVLCNFKWGGVTILQKREKIHDAVDFNRNWLEYRNGFGTLHANYWLGLEKMRHILKNNGPNGFQLDIHLFDKNFIHCVWHSHKFNIDGETSNYTASFGNIALSTHWDDWCDGMFNSLTPDSKPFSTYDHIGYPNNFNCTDREESGWWFGNDADCSYSNLNLKRIDDKIVVKTSNGTFRARSVLVVVKIFYTEA